MGNDILNTARSMLARADEILTGPTGVEIWHVVERLIERAEQSDRAIAVVTAERDALRAAGGAVLEAWKVTEAHCEDDRCANCGAALGEQHDDLCDVWVDEEAEALAQLKALVAALELPT